MTDQIKEAFRYYAPGSIKIDQIKMFLEWYKINPMPTNEAIVSSISILVSEDFICETGTEEWQICKINREWLEKNGPITS